MVNRCTSSFLACPLCRLYLRGVLMYYLWTKGWAERNGGNISVNVTDIMNEKEKSIPAISKAIPLQEAMTELGGNIFYVTGTGKRMRYVACNPFENGVLIRIAPDGNSYEIIAEQCILPTSELPSHLMMHNYLRKIGKNNRVVLHTHPTDLIGMTHNKHFLNSLKYLLLKNFFLFRILFY